MASESNQQALEISTWWAFCQVCTTITSRLEQSLQHHQALPLTRYKVLCHLAKAPDGEMRLQNLAQAVALSQSGLTRLLDRMAEARLITRQPCPHDRRGTYAVITPAGRALLAQATPLYTHTLRTHLAHHLTEAELETLHHLCQKILAQNTP